MAVITVDDIRAMGFSMEMLGIDTDSRFEDLVESIIDEQAGILEGRIGSTSYSSSQAPGANWVKRAEKCLVSAELVNLRRTQTISNAVQTGEKPETTPLERQRKDFLAEAETYIVKIISGVTVDNNEYSSAVVVSSGSTAGKVIPYA